jgi:hypothetical protein
MKRTTAIYLSLLAALALLVLFVLLSGIAVYRYGVQQEPYFRDLDHCEQWLKERVVVQHPIRPGSPEEKLLAKGSPWVGAIFQPRTPRAAGDNFIIGWHTPGMTHGFTIFRPDSSRLRTVDVSKMPRWGNVVHNIPPGHPLLKAIERAWREGGQI